VVDSVCRTNYTYTDSDTKSSNYCTKLFLSLPNMNADLTKRQRRLAKEAKVVDKYTLEKDGMYFDPASLEGDKWITYIQGPADSVRNILMVVLKAILVDYVSPGAGGFCKEKYLFCYYLKIVA
jgi:hypothetical protein